MSCVLGDRILIDEKDKRVRARKSLGRWATGLCHWVVIDSDLMLWISEDFDGFSDQGAINHMQRTHFGPELSLLKYALGKRHGFAYICVLGVTRESV